MKYDFKAARKQIEELTLMYRWLNYRGLLNEHNVNFLLEGINELEQEIAAAKEKMAARHGHHFSEQDKNFDNHIIPFSQYDNKEESLHEHAHGL